MSTPDTSEQALCACSDFFVYIGRSAWFRILVKRTENNKNLVHGYKIAQTFDYVNSKNKILVKNIDKLQKIR